MSSVNADELNQTGPMEPTTYKEAGVDLETYQESMSRLPQLMHRTYSPRVIQPTVVLPGYSKSTFRMVCLRAAMKIPYSWPELTALALS